MDSAILWTQIFCLEDLRLRETGTCGLYRVYIEQPHHAQSEVAFKVAGSMALRQGVLDGDPVLLEPVFAVEVVCPEDYYGDVVGDLNRRRGIVMGMEDVPAGKAVKAEVPLAEMFGYATDVRSMSQGRATFSMEFTSYKEVPDTVADAVISRTT